MKRLRPFFGRAAATDKGGSVPVPKSPTPPAPMPDFSRVPRAEVQDKLLHAVLEDDIGTLNLIHDVYPDCARWMVVIKGSSIGGAPITTPILFYAVHGSGAALQWLIGKGADLYAESNFAISPAVAFAASKGCESAVVQLLDAMKITDLSPQFFGRVYPHLSDVAKEYGHAALAAQLEALRKPAPPKMIYGTAPDLSKIIKKVPQV